MPDKAADVIDALSTEDPSHWLDLTGWKLQALLALVAFMVAVWGYRKVRRIFRRRRPPTIHPKLQKYGAELAEPTEELIAQRRMEAEHILATSSTPAIVGYEIVEQVEAVFVDGFRRPEEAIEGLKAVASLKGANAVANVRQDRNAAGKCSAQGDAVIVHRILQPLAEVESTPGEVRVEEPDTDTDAEDDS